MEGCPFEIEPEHLTARTEPIIDDWDNPPSLKVDPDNFWWRATQELLELGEVDLGAMTDRE